MLELPRRLAEGPDSLRQAGRPLVWTIVCMSTAVTRQQTSAGVSARSITADCDQCCGRVRRTIVPVWAGGALSRGAI